ncbi:MAG: hypothetical protein ACI9TP_001380, partial [Candidatus Azotimanducaceae bacterium]
KKLKCPMILDKQIISGVQIHAGGFIHTVSRRLNRALYD